MEIETMREKMIATALQEGFTSEKTLKLSEAVDNLLIKYYKYRKLNT
ncbi:Spo0E family sporulation regulatory protein-aspartic acid phosphatase [Priestia megaterium]|nr:Spo0E family sporulation regulatory protein-aspartic acid phosphatase [Priestia megaterium]